MLRIFTTLASFIFFFNSLNAQFLELTSATAMHNDQLQDAVKMEVEIPKEDLKDAFNDFVKRELNVDLKGYGFLTRKDEVYTEIQVLPSISSMPIKIILLFEESVGHTRLFLLGQAEKGFVLAQKTDAVAFSSLLRLSKDFLQYYVPVYYNALVDKANEQLEDASDELEKKEKDIENDEQDLIKLKQEILDLEKEIIKSKGELISLQSNVDQAKKEALAEREKMQGALDGLKKLEH